MPRNPRVPAYRLHKPSGQARVIVRGRHYYLGPYGSPESHEKYARLIAELATKPDEPVATPGQEMLVVQLLAAYWQYASGYYVKDGKPTSSLDHITLMIRMVREHYGSIPAVDFGPLCLKAIRAKLVDAGNSRKYVNKLVSLVPRMFKWAASEQLIPGRVYQDLQAVEGLRMGRTKAPERPPVLPVADAVVDATIPHLPSIVADMVRLERLTGCRPAEVCQIRPCDVDRSSGDVWLYRVPGHKTEHFGRERVICIGPKGQAVLRPYLLRPADAYCFSPAESMEKQRAAWRARRKTPVQPSQRSRRKARPKRKPRDCYTRYSYARAIRRGVERANRAILKDSAKAGIENPQVLPFWAPNQLRHSRATEVRRKYGLEAAQTTLGHSKADVTQIYAERDTKLAADIARKIG